MTTQSRTDKRYLDALGYRLSMLDVPGERSGEILAEVEAHIAATGESAVEAFGPAREYAAQWAPRRTPAQRRRRRATLTLISLVGAGLGALLGSSAVALGLGEPNLGVAAGWPLAVAVAGFLVMAAVLPLNGIVDPRPGGRRGVTRRQFLLGTAAACLVWTVALFLIGGML